MNSKLTTSVEQLKRIARFLVPWTYPQVPSAEEKEILMLKQSIIEVDGYQVICCFSEAQNPTYILKSLQIHNPQSPFLPFHMVCKIGRAFLGSDNLSYIEFFRNNRKVYCWALKTRNGESLPPSPKTKPASYEGFEFRILNPGSVDLF